MEKGIVRVYCCGGGGINIGSTLEKWRNRQENAFAILEPAYVDTSKSNLDRANLDATHCYQIKGKNGEELDGSGKRRPDNHEQIAEQVRDILQHYKPADLNIVLSTAGGGSGSVIAPSITAELLERGALTIVLIIGAATSKIDLENSLKTLKSYEGISARKNAPVVGYYLENNDSMSRAEVDTKIRDVILALAVLFSRQNHELDSRDLHNWLRYERVTSFKPQLTSLMIFQGAVNPQDFNACGNVISVATLAVEEAGARLPIVPDYHCVGYVESAEAARIENRVPLHYVIVDGLFTEAARHLQSKLDALDQAQQARINKKTILTDADQVLGDGLVL